jgi:diacylglycerol kinase family enzyme
MKIDASGYSLEEPMPPPPPPRAAAQPAVPPARKPSRRAGRVLLVVNANASRVTPRLREQVLEALAGAGRVEAVDAQSEDATVELCRAAASNGHELVAAFGGDGTVSAAARGVAGTGVPLACIPGGYTDVFARTIGVPRDPVEAAARLAGLPRRREPRSVALGTVDGRPYLFAAGIGFSAALMERMNAAGGAKTGLGSVYAGWQVAALAGRAIAGEAPRMTVDAGGRELEVVGAMAQNSDPLTFLGRLPIRVCEGAGLGPASFSLAALRSARVRDVARLAPAAVAGRADRVAAHPRMEQWPALVEARVTSLEDEGIGVEADGDVLGRRRSVELGVSDERLTILG